MSMLTVSEALDFMLAAARAPAATEIVPTQGANGRVLAEAQASTCRLDVEADAIIANGEVDGVFGPAKTHIEMLGPAVPHPVVQGFLADAEEAERHVRSHTPWNVLVAEINPDVFLPRELFTETPHRGHDAQMQQPWRVQFV